MIAQILTSPLVGLTLGFGLGWISMRSAWLDLSLRRWIWWGVLGGTLSSFVAAYLTFDTFSTGAGLATGMCLFIAVLLSRRARKMPPELADLAGQAPIYSNSGGWQYTCDGGVTIEYDYKGEISTATKGVRSVNVGQRLKDTVRLVGARRLDRAEESARQTYNHIADCLGRDHWLAAVALRDLALILCDLGKQQEAQRAFRTAKLIAGKRTCPAALTLSLQQECL